MPTWVICVICVICGSLFSGCVSTQPIPPPPITSPYTYVVGSGDILEIEVWKEPELQRVVAVSPDGHITFPIVGSVQVADKTLPQIADLMTQRLSEAVTAPIVTVTLKESRSAQVQLMGEVGRQGGIPFRSRLTLVEALGTVGGVAWYTAKTEDIHIVRGALDDPVLIAIDLDNLIVAAEKDVFLEPGDIVIVPPKYITRFDRYVTQLLSPFRSVVGTAQTAAGAAITGGVTGIR